MLLIEVKIKHYLRLNREITLLVIPLLIGFFCLGKFFFIQSNVRVQIGPIEEKLRKNTVVVNESIVKQEPVS